MLLKVYGLIRILGACKCHISALAVHNELMLVKMTNPESSRPPLCINHKVNV